MKLQRRIKFSIP
jgi:hypothetical protein